MSQAEELLNNLAPNETMAYSIDPASEPHIIINRDKTITIPDELKRILVQNEHNIETVTFDCPRYWDGHDLSELIMRIVFERSDGYKEPHPVENLRVDESDPSMIHFDWTISGNVTLTSGNVRITVCAKITDEKGAPYLEWHTIPNGDLFVNEGMDCSGDEIVERNPDIIDSIFAQLADLQNVNEELTDLRNMISTVRPLEIRIIGDFPDMYANQIFVESAGRRAFVIYHYDTYNYVGRVPVTEEDTGMTTYYARFVYFDGDETVRTVDISPFIGEHITHNEFKIVKA